MSDNALDPETLSPEKSIVENQIILEDEEGTQTENTGPSPMMGAVTSPFLQEQVTVDLENHFRSERK